MAQNGGGDDNKPANEGGGGGAAGGDKGKNAGGGGGGGGNGKNAGGGGGNGKNKGGGGGGGGNEKTGGGDGKNAGGGGGKNAGGGSKVEEVKPAAQPVKEQLPGIQYCINSPPPWRFQHYILTLGITVLIPTIIVPQMGGGDAEKTKVIQNLLFVSGLSTFLQSLFGTRLPIVVVGSYSYIIPIISIVQARRYNSYIDPDEYLHRYIKTVKPIHDRFAVLFTVTIAWLFAQLLTSSTAYNNKSESTQRSCRTDRAGLISSAPWLYFPYPFQWGSPTFNVAEAFAMMAASLVSLFEFTGTSYAAARYGSATPVPPSIISRGAGWALYDIMSVILMSHITVAASVAFILDLTLSREDEATKNDIGLKWWEKFSLYSSDVRNDEFYSLPCRLNELFPSV
ncbi:unnamed protein product [Trifolium pratense]|uniref:Uncharacterized protein n=1 Tax=Trifolium pratense TaxID=57577 RepID=A0ACB0JN92_TRIPR|nr:unnamed protein product [Trifolium pratense]